MLKPLKHVFYLLIWVPYVVGYGMMLKVSNLNTKSVILSAAL